MIHLLIKRRTLFTIAFILTIFTARSGNYISTAKAWIEYQTKLQERSYFAYPEARENPICWYDSIPEMKLKNIGVKQPFKLDAQPGEIFVYQLGVWALKTDVNNFQVKFTDLKAEDGAIISSKKMTCYNLGGTDFRGHPFDKTVNVTGGRVQALWIGIDLENISHGNYSGGVSVDADGQSQFISLTLNVSGAEVADHGYDQGSRLSRLNWLNSTVGINEEITKGYLPVKVHENAVSILGRTLTIAKNGLPATITSFFDPSNENVVEHGEPIVGHPFRFIIEKENGEIVRLKPGELTFTGQTPSRVDWKVLNTSPELDLECSGQLEYDGFVDYKLKLTTKTSLNVKDIRLEIPVEKDKAEYMMGLGQEGGYRTPDWKWKWDVTKNQDMLWIGAVNGGLRVKWKAENYVRPLVNIYYKFGPLKMPPSWGNDGKGGVNVGEQSNNVVISAYSGSRELKTGESLNYDFELLITPLKTINKQIKFGDRYFQINPLNKEYQAYTKSKIETAKRAGANILNIHQAEDIYPFINYPYVDEFVPDLKKIINNAHNSGMRSKVYYTTRELTKNLPEFWALNSLRGEVIFPGPGNASRTEALHPNGPNEWLIKNLREKYIPAWYNLINEGKFKGETDLSVITTPDSRLNNFYVAGLDWMVRNLDIDGIYIDDSALDHYTLRRARKLIDNSRPEGRIDLHSWNHFNNWAGYASCLNLYMDLLPYVDMVWIGEGRNYDRLSDHWLIEVSGIPFGLTGQMLEGGGNPWRGMVYGITTRAGWTPNPPTPLWKFFDEYHFTGRDLVGYWEKDCPVTCSDPNVKASVFKGKDDAIIAVASWSDHDVDAALEIDWKELGFDPAHMAVSIPEIQDFQSGNTSVNLEKLLIPGKKGYIIVLKNK